MHHRLIVQPPLLAGFSETNWHSDLRMAPFDTSAALTAWIPLTPIQV